LVPPKSEARRNCFVRVNVPARRWVGSQGGSLCEPYDRADDLVGDEDSSVGRTGWCVAGARAGTWPSVSGVRQEQKAVGRVGGIKGVGDAVVGLGYQRQDGEQGRRGRAGRIINGLQTHGETKWPRGGQGHSVSWGWAGGERVRVGHGSVTPRGGTSVNGLQGPQCGMAGRVSRITGRVGRQRQKRPGPCGRRKEGGIRGRPVVPKRSQRGR